MTYCEQESIGCSWCGLIFVSHRALFYHLCDKVQPWNPRLADPWPYDDETDEEMMERYVSG